MTRQDPSHQPSKKASQSTGNLGQKKAKAEKISDCKFEHMGTAADKTDTAKERHRDRRPN